MFTWLYVPSALAGRPVEHAFERLRRDSWTSLCGLFERNLPLITELSSNGRERCLRCIELTEEQGC